MTRSPASPPASLYFFCFCFPFCSRSCATLTLMRYLCAGYLRCCFSPLLSSGINIFLCICTYLVQGASFPAPSKPLRHRTPT
ncbi:hypothetical protein B0H14DRAFT_2811208 [Mycena olivaceomarginata]|nr:hypothetical protein B0H14DRAFT_2811208 [Mycena olivaceomarginata]